MQTLQILTIFVLFVPREMNTSSHIEDRSGGTSSVQVTSSSNGIISALRSALTVSKSSNFKVAGEGHRNVSLNSCSNINVEGTQGDLQLDSSSNTKITGNQNNVKAERTSNLIVQGNGNNVDVKNISNHVLQPSTFKNQNVLEVSSGTESNSMLGRLASYVWSSHRSSSSNGKKFHVDYVDSAKIVGPQYGLGIYRFEVEDTPSYVDVRVDPSAVIGLRVTPVEGGNAVELEGRGSDGAVQKLVLKGPRVTQPQHNVFRIDLLTHDDSL